MYKLIIIFLVFSFCSSTSVEDDSIVPQQNNENNNSSVSNESEESLITIEDNEEIENFSDQEQLIEDEYIEELPEPIFIDITDIYEPFINEELLSETKEYAIKADVEELLVYLDDILLFKLPEHIVEEIGGGIAWYVSKNTYTTWDGEPNAQDIDFGAECLPPGAIADYKTGGVSYMILPPDAHPLMILHEIAHHYKLSTENYQEITKLFGDAAYDDECNPIITIGEYDQYLNGWPVTETFEYAFNDFAVSNFFESPYTIDPVLVSYFKEIFSNN